MGLDMGENPPCPGAVDELVVPVVDGTPGVELDGVKPPNEDVPAEEDSLLSAPEPGAAPTLPPKYRDRGEVASGSGALNGWAVGDSVVASDDRRSKPGAEEGTCIGCEPCERPRPYGFDESVLPDGGVAPVGPDGPVVDMPARATVCAMPPNIDVWIPAG
jgi:hypothetical protein